MHLWCQGALMLCDTHQDISHQLGTFDSWQNSRRWVASQIKDHLHQSHRINLRLSEMPTKQMNSSTIKTFKVNLSGFLFNFFEWRLECCLQCPCNISWFWAQQNFHQHPALWCVFCLLVLIEDAAGIRTLVPHLTSLLHVTLRELPGMTLRSLLVEYLEPAITITFHTCLPQRPKRNKLVPLHRKKLSY